ncbi:MAG: hypothetical protein NTX82_06905 [Candidatus Parcubacteria bacterium]|nr:hypothetical protein [Candidatus Parcubacteria bacterium]
MRIFWQQKQWIRFGLFLILFFLLPYNLQAANLHTLSDRVSRHAPAIPSDHVFTFTTPSGLTGAGDYIRISFDGGFDLSAIIYSDVTLTHGSVTGQEISETVVADPTAVNWGLSRSGNHIDLIRSTGDIAPNDIVIISIGAAHKIVNPLALGSKIISLALYDIADNLIDSGRLAVPIADDQVGVNGAPLGTLPTPVILNFPYNVLTNSLDLDWSENLDFNFHRYVLYMGTSPGVTDLNGTFLPIPGIPGVIPDQANPTDPTLRTQTIFNIDGLAPARTYYFVVYVYNDQGNNAISNEVYATTNNSGNPWPPPPAQPTINQRLCPIFLPTVTIDGTKPGSTTIFINGDSENINYPTDLTWNKPVSLGLGANLFLIFARDSYGQNSPFLTATVNRCEVGDANCNAVIDDFDLAGLAGHWETNWCYADFNEDGIVDDFDLSGLAAHWDSVY